MALSIKSAKADQLARELAAATGESLTDAITTAIEERLARERRAKRDVAGRLRSVREQLREVAVVEDRHEDEILGFDAHGLPT